MPPKARRNLHLTLKQQKLFDSHLWLLFRVQKRFGYRCPDFYFDDLLQHCRMSLAYIASRWDFPKGISFGGRAWHILALEAAGFINGRGQYGCAALRNAAANECSLDEIITTQEGEEFTILDKAEAQQAERDYQRSCAERVLEFTWSEIESALSQLPDAERRVLELRFQGLKHVEIAKKIQLFSTKVGILEHQGIRHMRKLLADKGLKTLPPDAPIPPDGGSKHPKITPPVI